MCEHFVGRGFLIELENILREGPFTGQIVLHCNEGHVIKYDTIQTRRPENGLIDLSEGGLRKKSS